MNNSVSSENEIYGTVWSLGLRRKGNISMLSKMLCNFSEVYWLFILLRSGSSHIFSNGVFVILLLIYKHMYAYMLEISPLFYTDIHVYVYVCILYICINVYLYKFIFINIGLHLLI